MRAALAALAVGLACTGLPAGGGRDALVIPKPRTAPATAYTMRDPNRGPEPYSAWFADSDGRTVYFGLSPFWTLWWERDGDSAVDMEQPGDLVIGRFDLETERFGDPIYLREEGAGHSSVWDVLAHSSGRVCFTTYFDAMGCVDPATGEVQRFEAAGPGLNELVEGPGGELYVTRYSSEPLGDPAGDPAQSYGAVAVIGMDGLLLREHRLPNPPGGLTAAKSLAVDPETGQIWVNTDTFLADGSMEHETILLDAAGHVVSRQGGDPQLHFPSFSPDGIGFFAETEDGALYLRIVLSGVEQARLALGQIGSLDFVQDIKHGADGEAVLALWSGKVFIVRRGDDGWSARAASLQRLSGCAAAEGRSLVYSAFTRGDRVCATLFCSARVICASQDQEGGDS